MPLTDEQIREMTELEAKATPGPWIHQERDPWVANDRVVRQATNEHDGGFVILRSEAAHSIHWKLDRGDAENYEFIARARAFVPSAIEEIARLKAELEQARRKAKALDWLAVRGVGGRFLGSNYSGYSDTYTVRDISGFLLGEALSALEAIEAAMESEVPR